MIRHSDQYNQRDIGDFDPKPGWSDEDPRAEGLDDASGKESQVADAMNTLSGEVEQLAVLVQVLEKALQPVLRNDEAGKLINPEESIVRDSIEHTTARPHYTVPRASHISEITDSLRLVKQHVKRINNRIEA